MVKTPLVTGFRAAQRLFEPALRICDRSEAFHAVRAELRSLLALGDRHALACLGDPELRKGAEVAGVLEQSAEGLSGDSVEAAEQRLGQKLLVHLEPWLKAVLRWVDPSGYAGAQKRQSQFNLYAVFLRLGLLSQAELELPLSGYTTMADKARGYLLLAKEQRNEALHSLAEQGLDVERVTPTARALTLLVALFIHHRALRRALRGLIVRPLVFPASRAPLVDAMRAERARHLEFFAGRGNSLERIHEALALPGTGWIVVTGTAGMGKSALSAALTKELSAAVVACGPARTETMVAAPWLPGALLHLGKQCKQVDETVNGMLTQAGSLLLEPLPPVDVRVSGGIAEAEWDIDVDSRSGASRPWRGIAASEGAEPWGFRLRARGPAIHIQDRCRASLHQALARLVEERGEAALVIDGLDEILGGEDGYSWLPRDLPTGCRAIAFSRDDAALARFLEDRPEHLRVHLEGLDRKEIALVLRVDEREARAFLDEVEAKTSGWPTAVAPLARKIRDRGKWQGVPVEMREEYLKGLAGCWQGVAREALLDVLSAFEPCCPLPVEALQGFLAHRGLAMRLSQVRDALAQVADQLAGLEAQQVRLALGPFGEYLRRTHYSRRDWRTLLVDVANWLAGDCDVGDDIAAAFFAVWALAASSPIAGLEVLAEPLLGCLVGVRGGNILWAARDTDRALESAAVRRIAERAWTLGCQDAGTFWGAALIDAGEPERGQPILEQLAAIGNVDAKRVLAVFLLKRSSGLGDRKRGDSLLREAAVGDSRAKALLAEFLIDGRAIPRHPGEGLQLLRHAAEDDAVAGRRLAERLIDGRGIDADPEEGLRLLRRAAQDDAVAQRRLADRLLDGIGVEQNQSEGLALLQNAAQHSTMAKLKLAERLLDGNGTEPDSAEGLRLLMEAAAEDAFAKLRLAERLLDGNGVQRAPEAGLKLLREAALEGDWAKQRLGERLLDGGGVAKDAVAGAALLRELAENHDDAKATLGERLIDGRGIPRDAVEGLRLLREAARNDDDAKAALGERLIDGRGIPKDAVEGLRLLREAAQYDNDAKAELACRMLDGDGLPRETEEGLRLLREAAKANQHAGMTLGMRLLDGDGVAPSPAEGLSILRELADRDVYSKWELAERLLDGRGVAKDPHEGLRLLRDAALRDGIAKSVLARRLLDGNGVPQAIEEGLALLRDAAGVTAVAKLALAVRLLDGNKLPRDTGEGMRLLREAACVNVDAMTELGIRLLEADGAAETAHEGAGLLREAAQTDLRAKHEFAIRLLDGRGFPQDHARGLALLREAAERSPGAKAQLGVLLLDGNGVPQDSDGGLRLLRDASSESNLAKLELGDRLATGKGVPPDHVEGMRLMREAAADLASEEHCDARAFGLFSNGSTQQAFHVLLAKFLRDGDPMAGNNAAYMLRRNLVEGLADCPSVRDLLAPGLAAGEALAITNHVLWRVEQEPDDDVWRAADDLLAATSNVQEVLDWWLGLARDEDDPEGHLVVGWLNRHGHATDGEATIAQRMDRARAGGWMVPAWLDVPVGASRGS